MVMFVQTQKAQCVSWQKQSVSSMIRDGLPSSLEQSSANSFRRISELQSQHRRRKQMLGVEDLLLYSVEIK